MIKGVVVAPEAQRARLDCDGFEGALIVCEGSEESMASVRPPGVADDGGRIDVVHVIEGRRERTSQWPIVEEVRGDDEREVAWMKNFLERVDVEDVEFLYSYAVVRFSRDPQEFQGQW